MIAYGEGADGACDNEADRGGKLNAVVDMDNKPIGKSTENARHGVNLLAEDDRLVVEQHVADYSSCGTCDATHDDCHSIGLTKHDAFLYARYGEEGEAKGVEHEPCVFQRLNIFGKRDHKDEG